MTGIAISVPLAYKTTETNTAHHTSAASLQGHQQLDGISWAFTRNIQIILRF